MLAESDDPNCKIWSTNWFENFCLNDKNLFTVKLKLKWHIKALH